MTGEGDDFDGGGANSKRLRCDGLIHFRTRAVKYSDVIGRIENKKSEVVLHNVIQGSMPRYPDVQAMRNYVTERVNGQRCQAHASQSIRPVWLRGYGWGSGHTAVLRRWAAFDEP